jgi:hypothetical protein
MLITLLMLLSIIMCIVCWKQADNYEPGSLLWLLFVFFSSWNAVEVLNFILN